MGLAMCAVAGVLGGLAVAEGVDYAEDKITGLRFAIVVDWVGVCGLVVVGLRFAMCGFVFWVGVVVCSLRLWWVIDLGVGLLCILVWD